MPKLDNSEIAFRKRLAHRIVVDRSMRLISGATLLMTVAPALAVLSFLCITVVMHSHTYIDQALTFWVKDRSNAKFVVIAYSLTAAFHFPLAFLTYYGLVQSAMRRRWVVGATKAIARVGTSLPVALICVFFVWPLDQFGISKILLPNPIFLSALFAVALLPTSAFLMCDLAAKDFEMNTREIEAGYNLALTTHEVLLFWIGLFRGKTLRYLGSLAMFSSFRVVVELGFFKAVTDEGRGATFQEFVQNFYGTFDPSHFAGLGFAFLLVAFVGVILTLVVR